MRKLRKLVGVRYTDVCKGKKESNKFFTHLMSSLKQEFPGLENYQDLMLRIMGPIASMIYKSQLQMRVTGCTLFSDEDKQKLITYAKDFKKNTKHFSKVGERRDNWSHPIFAVAKFIVLSDPVYEDKFWALILHTRKKAIKNFQGYKDMVMEGIRDIPELPINL